MIAHIVLFTPRADLSDDTRRSFARLLQRSGREIPGIKRAVVGRAVDIDAGYERLMGQTAYQFAAILEFDDRGRLLGYLNHPLHKELGRMFWDCCDRAVVVEADTRDVASDEIVDFLVD